MNEGTNRCKRSLPAIAVALLIGLSPLCALGQLQPLTGMPQPRNGRASGASNAGAEPMISIFNMGFESTLYIAGPNPYAIAAADFTGKGNLDVVVADLGDYNHNATNNTVGVLLNNGDGTFQPVVQYTVGLGPTKVVVGDFNGDGKLDIAVSSVHYSNGPIRTLSILLGNGDGTFQPALTTSMPVSGNLAVGDFNHDGKLDLVINDSYTLDGCQIAVLFGNGDGTFQSPVIIPIPVSTLSTVATNVAVGDFNGDGKLDLVVTTWNVEPSYVPTPDVIAVLSGNGDGTFQPAVFYNVGLEPNDVVLADFNHDGNLDIAVTTVCNWSDGYADCVGDGAVSVLLGNGDGTFQPQNSYTVGQGPFGIATADFNGDGNLDLVLPNAYDETLMILYGNGYGGFTEQTYGYGHRALSLVAGQFSKGGAGSADMVVANWDNNLGNTITALLNEAGTHITLSSSPNPSTSAQAVTFAATVAASAPGFGVPTGNVAFMLGSATLGTASLTNGVATFTAAAGTLPTGKDNIVAAYSGDSNFNPNNSALVQTVTAGGAAQPSFTLPATPNAVTITQGNSETTTITIKPKKGFTGKVTLSASGLPSGVKASFSPDKTTSSSTLKLKVSSSAKVGESTITITGTSGSLSNKTRIRLTVGTKG